MAAAKEGLLDLIEGKVPEFGGIQFEAAARPIMDTLTRDTRQDYVRKLQNYVQYDARLGAISAHLRLLAAVERIIQAPPPLFATQAMIKPPLIGREKPWHQDHAFFRVKLGARRRLLDRAGRGDAGERLHARYPRQQPRGAGSALPAARLADPRASPW